MFSQVTRYDTNTQVNNQDKSQVCVETSSTPFLCVNTCVKSTNGHKVFSILSCKIKKLLLFHSCLHTPIYKSTLNFTAIYNGYLSINYTIYIKQVNRLSVFTYDFRLVPGLWSHVFKSILHEPWLPFGLFRFSRLLPSGYSDGLFLIHAVLAERWLVEIASADNYIDIL